MPIAELRKIHAARAMAAQASVGESAIGNRKWEMNEAREAQMAEHSIGNREVASSIPAAGSGGESGWSSDDGRRSSVSFYGEDSSDHYRNQARAV